MINFILFSLSISSFLYLRNKTFRIFATKLTRYYIMDNFMFYSPTEFVFGRDTEHQTGRLVKNYGGKRVLIVYGGGSAIKSGLIGRVEDSFRQFGIESWRLAGVAPNPTDEKVYEGIEICRKNQIDFLLGVGGGSAIDTAKAIAAGVVYEGDFWDFYEGIVTISKSLPIGVVLTIPAAGSEGSGNSVITKASLRKKISLRTPKALRPKFAIMNPALTFTLPSWQTASGAVDMMAHVMERYFTNTPNTEITDRLGEGVLRAIIDITPQVLSHPTDYDARANLMWSGTMAHNGICGTGREEDWACHFMEHEVSAIYGVTHGAGLAVIFPAWLTWMEQHHSEKVTQWAQRVWDAETAKEGIEKFKTFLTAIGMPITFKQLGVAHPDIPLLVKSLHEHKGETVGNYVKLNAKQTTEIFNLCL